jgi:hypothetical protein
VSYFFCASAGVAAIAPKTKMATAVDLNRFMGSSRYAVAMLCRAVLCERLYQKWAG